MQSSVQTARRSARSSRGYPWKCHRRGHPARRHATCRYARMAELQRATSIVDLLTPELVLPDLSARTKPEVLDALATHVGLAQPDVDVGHVRASLHERERQSTTALENGVAIPHVRLPGLPAALAVLARSRAGIECGAVDGQPTRLFLLLVVAIEQPGGHLRLLANASRLLSDHACRARLLEAPSAVELLAALREHERRIPHGLRAA